MSTSGTPMRWRISGSRRASEELLDTYAPGNGAEGRGGAGMAPQLNRESGRLWRKERSFDEAGRYRLWKI